MVVATPARLNAVCARSIMQIKTVRALKSVISAVIASNSASSPVVVPAQIGGGLRLGVLIRNTGSVEIEAFYDDATATAGTGVPIPASAAIEWGEQVAFPLSFSFRSKTTDAGAVAVSWVETDNA